MKREKYRLSECEAAVPMFEGLSRFFRLKGFS